ncbi:leucine-rich repeat protein [Anaerostipes hadrus]|uniref:leucine-rich repeat protein n=1 Tax=Anaerostipes hadrus TaxID=649756 RepID=UPI0015715CA1|nr:leucine-rich repeat protein [Anaerostipes hadrus]NSH12395.1 leucine-rich repeat protein [Anaerostipes hadrus]NSH21225.1 leucine-rich repeat protein [Anaerostipes hadrus]NSH35606.1 leucine-rich repeat protein [Anaerostipes hadrus]NSH56172.1 leucine-rich repeat protein [Anaerostipes hadrus]
MRKLRKVVPFGLAVMMSLQGIYPAVPVMADTVKVAAAKKTTSSATVLSKKERAKIMQQINAMSPEEGLKLAKKKGIIKEDTNAKESNLKKATANKDAKEGEVGYQFTQDQYVDETHRIRYEYIITAEGEVSADYVNGVIYENGSPKVNYLDEVQTYEINDKLTYPSEVTLNGTTYQVKSALFHNTTAKHVIVPEGVESCMGCSSATDMEILTIPSTLKKIGSGFRSCPSSHNYYDSGFLDTRNNATFKGYEMTNPKKAKYLTVKDGIVYNKEETEMLTKVPCALEKDTLVLPDTIKEIPEGAFMSNKTVKKVVFGKNITFIGNGAFAYSNIENVQMNDSVTVLDEYAFYYCTKLANVDLSKSLTKIDGYETFKYTAALKHINLKNVTELTGWYTFQQSGLEDVDLSNVSNLAGVQQFVYCRDLRNVYIGKDTDFTNDVGMGVNLFYGCTALENYAEKEKNQHHLYVENGRLYASEMKGSFKTENDGDFVDKLYKGKILVGYSIKQQINDVKNGTLKIDDDITGIAMGGAPVSSDLKKGTNNLKDVNTYFSKLIIPSSVEVIDTINTLPVSNLEIDFYGNEIPTIGSIVSQTQYGAEEDSAVLGTKTLNFKTDALKEKYDKSWKYQTLDVYMNEKIILAVLPEKKTTSLSLNKTSDKILCDGNSHEIHLIAKLSEDDCTDVVTFKSSNEDLATVDGNGVVTTKENAHGTATITATAGNHTATYKLTQAGSGIDVTADQKTIVYKEWWETENLLDNIKQSIHVTCADCHNNLRRDKDYEVIVSDYKKTGKVDVTIKGIGAFEGMTAKTSVNVEYHKHGEQGYRIDNLYSGYNWTGKEVKPDVTIRCADCNKELKEGTDYKLEYKNNVNVGTATVKVVGMGAYEGVDQTANFEIEEDCGWNGIAVNDNAYQDGDHIGTYKWSRWKENGNLPTVVIVCKHCGKWLTKDTDYKLEYSNKDHPGDGTLKVTGLNKYAGYELNFKYTLSPKTFYSNEHSDGDDLGTFRYTGKAIKADIGTLYIENTDTEAVKGKDYQLEYSNNIEEGTATVKVVGIGDAKGTVLTYTYHIEKQHGWNGFSVTGHKDGDDLGSYEWTGNEVEPELNLTCNHCGETLVANRDYELEYTGDRTEPGKVTVKVIGTRDYEGWTQSFTYTIKNKTFSFEDHKDGEDLGSVEYTGSEVRYPISNVTDKTGKTLSEGTDYKLVYSDNTKPGTANVQIIGLNDYDGCTLSFTYTIVDHDGESGFHNNLYTDGADMGSYAYTGEEVKPSIGLMYSNYNQTFLIEGVDYKVEYSNNINPGTATAKVIGIGRYAGHEMSFTYTIKNKSFAAKDHKDGENLGTLKWTGKAQTMKLGDMIDPIDGHVLKEGTDYKIVYSDNVDAGTAKAEVIGSGYYEGSSLTFYYTIEKQHGWNGFYSKGHKDGESLGTFKWTGNNILIDPDMRCSHCDKELQENVDYKVEYSNNIDPGVASMKIIGMGDYKGYELNFTFVIEKKAPTTTEDQKPTTTTETKPTTGTTENSSATSETKPTTGTTAVTTTTTEDKTTTTTESKPTTEDKTTATTESKPTISSTTTETKPSTGTSSTSGTTTAEKETATTAAPVIRISVKKAAIQKIKALKKAFTINILKNKDQVTGYQISYSYKKNFKGQKIKDLKKFKYKKIKVKRKKYTIVSYKVKGLKRKKTAYIRVRAYKQVGKTKVYGKWSSVKKVKIK